MNGLFPYLGGKERLLPDLLPMMEAVNCHIVWELCCGAGALTFNMHADVLNVNDFDKSIAVIYKAMTDESSRYDFIDIIEGTYYDKEIFDEHHAIWEEYSKRTLDSLSGNELARAGAASWIIHRLSRWGDYKKGYYNSISNAESYENSKIDLYTKMSFEPQLIVHNEDANNLIDTIDISEEVLIVADPPYLKAIDEDSKSDEAEDTAEDTAGYTCKFNHVVFCKKVIALPKDKCKIIICNYNNALYNKMLVDKNGWSKYLVKDIAKQCAHTAIKPRAQEYVYCNFSL